MAIDLPTELIVVRRSILTMGATVAERLDEAIAGLLEGDIDAALTVRHGDSDIDEMEVDIEAECLRVLALTHPVASDLRFVFAVLRINNDLERMADLIASLAKRAISLSKSKFIIERPSALQPMAASTRQMVNDALAALADGNVKLAQQIRRADDRVDDFQKEIFAWVRSEIPLHVERSDALIDMLSVARKLERIADLSTNIAENVIYLAEGRNVRHESPGVAS